MSETRETETREEPPDTTEHCVICGTEGIKAPATDNDFEEDTEEETNNYLGSVYVKPILTELFPAGFEGRPFEYLQAKSFILPFCTECEAEVRGVLYAKIEIENLRKLIDASLTCIQIKVKDRKRRDDYPDEDSKILGQRVLGLPKTKARKGKEDSAETVAAAVNMNDHSDLIALAVEASGMRDDEDSTSNDNVMKSNGENRETKRKRGRPRRGSIRTPAPKVVKQVQAPKVLSQVIEPGVFKYKDHVYRSRPDGKWECDTCHVILKERHCCISHINDMHIGQKRGMFVCEICGKVFDRSSSLKVHSGIHRGKPYMCQWCGKVFALRGTLKQHVTAAHEGELNHVCDFEGCDRRFINASQLKLHQLRHFENKPFLCEHCSKGFVRQGELEIHKRTHTGERPYACNICASRFFIKGRLRRHYQNVHGISPEIVPRTNAVLPVGTVPVAVVVIEEEQE